MSTVARPRGPLPARVYWTRRILVLVMALGLVFGIARLLGGSFGGDGSDPQAARTVGSVEEETPGQPGPTPSAGDIDEEPQPTKKRKKKTLAQPEGPCDPADVRITPRVRTAHAGSPVRIVLELTTRESPACTWEVSPETVVLKLTSGIDPIWSSQECPASIPTEAVVPRRKKADKVRVTWNAKRSDSECSAATDWALPGWYHAEAVARGSVKPVEEQFELKNALVPTRTATPTATPDADEQDEKPKNKSKKKNKKDRKKQGRDGGRG